MTFGGADLNRYPGSDLLGRSMAFNGTLLFTSLFGLGATITTSFWSLCVTLFLLGSAVGVRGFTKRTRVRELKVCTGINANRRHADSRTVTK